MKRLNAYAMAGLLVSGPAVAQVDQQELELLREQVRMLSQRLEALEAASDEQASELANVSQTVASVSNAPTTASTDQQTLDDLVDEQVDARFSEMWTSRIRWKGDFRYRYEHFDIEGTEDRNRSRIRARAGLEAQVSEDMKVGLGMASGGDDPVSTNQTLGGGGSTKGLNLDLAYFAYTGWENFEVVGGKFKNLLYRPGGNGLLWDGDWNPEGTGVRFENGTFFATGLGTWLESDSRGFNDEFSYGVQAGINMPIGDDMQLVAGLGFFKFDAAGKSSFYGDDDDFFGNSFNPITNTYLYDYHELEAFAELSFDVAGQPVSVFADYVTNSDADQDDTGYAFGVKAGKASAPGTWDFGLVYQKLEADAVFGLLTDSDFGGGGTNVDGFVLKGKYAFHKKWAANMTYFINQTAINSNNPRDFNRLQMDLSFKYD